jgi:hypothetical protein
MSTQNGGERTVPSQYQVREITSRGMPVPPTYLAAQALLDSFEPTPAQQRRLDENGLSAANRGEAKQVLADLVAQNPQIAAEWEAQNAAAKVARTQARRGEQPAGKTSYAMYNLLVAHGVTEVPTDSAAAAKLIDDLPPSEPMIALLRGNGRVVPATRAEASEIIGNLPATPGQTSTIALATSGRYWPRTRGDAQRWFRENPRVRNPEQELEMAA